MGGVVFGAWIPRSYLHVYEVKSKIKDVSLKVKSLASEDGVSFNFKTSYGLVVFKLDGSGLYSFELKKNLPESKLKKLRKSLKLISAPLNNDSVKVSSLGFCLCTFQIKKDIRRKTAGFIFEKSLNFSSISRFSSSSTNNNHCRAKSSLVRRS